MPAETNQRGRSADATDVLDLLLSLLSDPDDATAGSTLAALGVDDEDLDALWDAVCEEYAERSLAPELEPELLQIWMTLEAAACIMAAWLSGGSHATG